MGVNYQDEEYDEVVELDPSTWLLGSDLRQAAKSSSADEVRYLVDSYYNLQDWRKRAVSQTRAQTSRGEPGAVSVWLATRTNILEGQLKAALDLWSKDQGGAVGWSRSIKGIGPVLAAGLAAHIDIEKAPTVGHIWSFAGIVPGKVWGKGQPCPWNARLKVLTWKVSKSIVMSSNAADSFYGQKYKLRKEYEVAKNERGDYAEQAAALLERVPKHRQKAIYEKGTLPPGHIDARARRWTVKLFLSGWHEVAYFCRYQAMPPRPYPIDRIPGHEHLLPVPNSEIIPGLKEAEDAWLRHWRSQEGQPES
jgi:hypothetical protein